MYEGNIDADQNNERPADGENNSNEGKEQVAKTIETPQRDVRLDRDEAYAARPQQFTQN